MKLYNTLTRKKEEFTPIEAAKVKMYMCGPTVYNLMHIGNARPLVVFDAVRRYLLYKGYGVVFVQNFTDVDDKIIKKAAEENVSTHEIAEKYIKEYEVDRKGLNVLEADKYPRVTEHMTEIVEMVRTLVDKNFAYVLDDGTVIFDTQQFEEYGKLSKKKIDELEAGSRVEADKRKKAPSDFVLWKPAKEGEPFWPSDWCNGRPGWHIECSAMSKKYLGSTFDIHCGGDDLIFPHHENEIAQSECANGAPFVNYWLHNAMIFVNSEKMAKSLGNFSLLRNVAAEYGYDVTRFFILSAHYRSPLNFAAELLQSAANSYERIKNCYNELFRKSLNNSGNSFKPEEGEKLKELLKFEVDFCAAMDDDFNTANAITAIFDFVKFANVNVTEQCTRALAASVFVMFKTLTDVLGFDFTEKINRVVNKEEINILIEERNSAKKAKNFAKADEIRQLLLEMGVELKDTREGTKWTLKD